MTVNDCFICPMCGNSALVIEDARPLLSDTRMDTLRCNNCGAQWRTYSKIVEIQTEIIQYPSEQPTIDKSSETVDSGE